MSFSELVYLIRSDLYRYAGKTDFLTFVRNLIVVPGFNYSFWMRACGYLERHRIWRYTPVALVGKLFLRHCRFRYGISIRPESKIGSGLYIGHFGNIVVNAHTVIGKNCSIFQGVTLAQSNRGDHQGYPVIGDNVFIGPGAKIIGSINVGNNVVVGANCVVTKDVPDNSVVVGIPGRVISDKGSAGYIRNPDFKG